MTNRFLPVVILTISATAPLARAADIKQIEKDLKTKYVGKVLTLRNFYTTDWLRYNADGKLIGAQETGTWTLYSMIDVKKIRFVSDLLAIDVNRRAALYEAKKKTFEPARTGLPLHIEIEFPFGSPDETGIERAMTNVFTTTKEDLVDLVPPLWGTFLKAFQHSPDVKCSESLGVRPTAKDGISFPKLLSKADPGYTEAARRARIEGTVRFCVVIQKDGKIGPIELLQPIGLGLDEAAVDAVKLWRFQPATKDGDPIDTNATVEVTFRFGPS